MSPTNGSELDTNELTQSYCVNSGVGLCRLRGWTNSQEWNPVYEVHETEAAETSAR